jgi:Short C-terminal domain
MTKSVTPPGVEHSTVCSVLVAAADEPKLGTWKSPVLWTTLSLVVVVLLGALVITVVDRWRKRLRQDRSDLGDQLSHFRSLYDRGELTREEFERIRGKLGSKLRQEMNVPAAAKPPEPAKTEAPTQAEPTAAESPKPPEPPVNGQANA